MAGKGESKPERIGARLRLALMGFLASGKPSKAERMGRRARGNVAVGNIRATRIGGENGYKCIATV